MSIPPSEIGPTEGAVPEELADLPPENKTSCFAWFAKISSIRYFIIPTILAIFISSVSNQYFRSTSYIWMEHFNFSPLLADWIMIFNDVAQLQVAFVLIKFNKRINRLRWIVATMISVAFLEYILGFLEACAITADIKEKKYADHFQESQICPSVQFNSIQNNSLPHMTLIIIMFVYQLLQGSATLVLFITAVTFIDDHTQIGEGIVHIGHIALITVAGYYMGKVLSWFGAAEATTTVFVTPGWLTISASTLIVSALVWFFPNLFHRNIRSGVKRYFRNPFLKTDFKSAIGRLCRNRTYILNLGSCIFVSMAVENFIHMNNEFIESTFYISDELLFISDWHTQLMGAVVEPICVISMIFMASYVITLVRPKALGIAGWNALVAIILPLLFGSYLFIDCPVTVDGLLNDARIMQNPDCSVNCDCSNVKFNPICFENMDRTFFSPCHAGCMGLSFNGANSIYLNCSCAPNPSSTSGMLSSKCQNTACKANWFFMKNIHLCIVMLAGSSIVPRILLAIRSVDSYDRPTAIVLFQAIITFTTHVPGKIIYTVAAYYSCHVFNEKNECILHSSTFPFNIVLITVTILIVGAVFAIGTVIVSWHVDLYVDSGQLQRQASLVESFLSIYGYPDGYDASLNFESYLTYSSEYDDSDATSFELEDLDRQYDDGYAVGDSGEVFPLNVVVNSRSAASLVPSDDSVTNICNLIEEAVGEEWDSSQESTHL